MKNILLSATISLALAGAITVSTGAPVQASPAPTSSGSNDAVAALFILAIGAFIFGSTATSKRARSLKKTTKSPNSQF